MKKFNFRLQKVLEYRRLQEEWARDAYLDARTSRLEAEMSLIEIGQRRNEVLRRQADTLDGLRTLEIKLKKLDDKEIEQQIVVNVLFNEEEKALSTWTEKKIELELLQKMYDKEFAQWQREADRSLQRELDDWALRRRAA